MNFKPLKIELTLQDKVKLNIKCKQMYKECSVTYMLGFFPSFFSFFLCFSPVTCLDTSFMCEFNGPEHILMQRILVWVRNLINSPPLNLFVLGQWEKCGLVWFLRAVTSSVSDLCSGLGICWYF